MKKTRPAFDYETNFMGLSVTGSNVSRERLLHDDLRVRSLISSVRLKKGAMLDIGCGGGTLTEHLGYFYPQIKIYGCDISSQAIRLAKKYGSHGVTYGVIKSQRLPYPDGFFDVCLCLDVLEHVPDIYTFLSEVRRVLKDDGNFYLIVPCERQWFTLTWLFQTIKIGHMLTNKHYGHVHPEFTHDYVEGLLTGHGFMVKEKRYGEHIAYQLLNFFQYYLPKELMEVVLGKKKAEKYYDRSLILSQDGTIRQKDPMFLVRFLWEQSCRLTRFIPEMDARLLNRIGFSAWKLLVLAQKRNVYGYSRQKN